MNRSESELIRAAQQGDQGAISDLYRQHVQAIYRYIYARVGQPALAEDMTSDVFVRAIETLPRYEDRGVPFVGWLYRIAQGRVIDHYRQSGRRGVHQNIEGIALSAEDDPEQMVFAQMEQQQLLRHLQTLTEDQQQVLLLRFIQGHDLENTARLLDKSIGAIKSLQFRALQSLARLFEEGEK